MAQDGYDPTNPVLKALSFHISQGETLGITGQSGSGKTTIVRLLARFYEADSGQIRINNQSIHQYDLKNLRISLGIVFQENLILDDTIQNNITYGNKKIAKEKIIQAAEVSHAHDFIKVLPDQYETLVGARGKTLSGGQRQRLAIARALITDPDILVLDEGTSFLEVEQEETILKKIKEIRKNKITLIISHRLSAIRFAERILTLDNGKIITTDFQSLINK